MRPRPQATSGTRSAAGYRMDVWQKQQRTWPPRSVFSTGLLSFPRMPEVSMMATYSTDGSVFGMKVDTT
jgi:hypothetical protein